MTVLIRYAAFVMTLAVLSAATIGTARQPTRATDTEVTWVIFSGRVDPVWVLTRSEAAEFRRRLDALPRAPGPAAEPTRLGFLRIMLPLAKGGRQPVTIDRGTVDETTGTGHLHRLDIDRALETWLLETGEGRVPEIRDTRLRPFRP